MDCSLPEALRVVSGCSRCPAMRHSLLEAARGVELGDSPGEVLSRGWPFGAVARPLLNSADSGRELSLAIRETRELMDRHAEHYHALCLAVLPPAAVAVGLRGDRDGTFHDDPSSPVIFPEPEGSNRIEIMLRCDILRSERHLSSVLPRSAFWIISPNSATSPYSRDHGVYMNPRTFGIVSASSIQAFTSFRSSAP